MLNHTDVFRKELMTNNKHVASHGPLSWGFMSPGHTCTKSRKCVPSPKSDVRNSVTPSMFFLWSALSFICLPNFGDLSAAFSAPFCSHVFFHYLRLGSISQTLPLTLPSPRRYRLQQRVSHWVWWFVAELIVATESDRSDGVLRGSTREQRRKDFVCRIWIDLDSFSSFGSLLDRGI